MPFLISTGYIRLVGCPEFAFCTWVLTLIFFERVVVLKDQHNKKAHEDSAQLACEAAGAIRTVASLTREDDCLDLYSKCLEKPLRESKIKSFWSNLLFSVSQSFAFFVISLTFWYGSRLVSYREFTSRDFFVGLMVSSDGHQSERGLTIK